MEKLKPKFQINLPWSSDLDPKPDTPFNVLEIYGNSVVIVGANGAGKSKLGAWIENKGPQRKIVHRIGAQRSLSLPSTVTPKGTQQSQNELLFGTATINTDIDKALKDREKHRWKNATTTSSLEDYGEVIAALFAEERVRNKEYVDKVKIWTKGGTAIQQPPPSNIDTLKTIWDKVVPKIILNFEEDKITASMVILHISRDPKSGKRIQKDAEHKYEGREMSDGERELLYLIGQCLCVPRNAILVIDEPEIHLHKSIMRKLWNELEQARPDCLFIYITHDLDFAASRVGAPKIWVTWYYRDKRYELFNYLILSNDNEWPEQLLFQLMGEELCLVIEGDKKSLDYQIYSLLYPNYSLISRGGCEEVISTVKAFQRVKLLPSLKIYGIIDRDFRTNEEVLSLEKNNIFTLEFSEIENLLIIEDLIRVISTQLGIEFTESMEKVKDLVFKRLSEEFDAQISHGVTRSLKRQLSRVNDNTIGESKIKTNIEKLFSTIDVAAIYKEYVDLYQKILDNRDYREVLKYYNRKSLITQISSVFGLNSGEYEKSIFRFLKGGGEQRAAILNALQKNTPHLPDK